MPYSGPKDPSLPPHVKRMPNASRIRWIGVFNSCMERGGDDGECMRLANGVVKMEFATFKDVELFRTGTWTDSSGKTNKWTEADLAGIASAYSETKDNVHPPIKLGHNDKQRFLGDEPAAGWVENIRNVGDKLIGDLVKVPDQIANLIKEGAYRARSVELNPDFEVEGKTYKWLLTGIALLGSRLPAVDGLADIVKLYEVDEKSNVYLYEQDDFEAELQAVFDRLEGIIKHRQGAPHIRALQSALKNAIKAHTKRSDNEMDKAKLAKMLDLPEDATEEDIENKIRNLGKSSNHDNDNSEHAAELVEANKRILTLENRIANNDAEAAVNDAIKAGQIAPASRETALKVALSGMDNFKAFVATLKNGAEFGERGSGGGTEINYAKYEPTESDITAAKLLGVYQPTAEWKLKFMRTKANADGVIIPDDFGKVKA